jgi:NADPH:quinone reductase-like Zn-dependent oxidoreductase
MLAVAFDTFGPPNVLRTLEFPIPVPAKGEVLVRVAAATVNPTDVLMRSGRQAALMVELRPPYIAGMEFSGHVAQTGAGSDALRPGARVMGVVNPRRPGGGAHAQYLCVSESSLVPIDDSADLVEAATLPMNGLTALMCLEALGLTRNQTVLVTGGAGAVGGYVIQLARRAGLTVLADAKNDDAALLSELGAQHIVPRGPAMAQAVKSLYPEGLDGLVDAALVGASAAALIRDGGVAVSLRSSHTIQDGRLRCSFVSVVGGFSRTADLSLLATLHHEGVITARIARRLPMTEAALAHELVERGHLRGRVVLLFES